MYNLLISSDPETWERNVWEIELARCVREYTDDEFVQKYKELTDANIAALVKLPCIFAYEQGNKKDPKFGLIEDIKRRNLQVRITIKLVDVGRFLTYQELEQLTLELDVGKWELNRTHWALKDVDLAKELHRAFAIKLPEWAGTNKRAVDVAKNHFDVGLSFPGENRSYVENVAKELESLLGPNRYFYDNNYVAQLARPSLDQLLEKIYRKQCGLIVVFLSAAYDKKEWCGLEFRAVRDIILERKHDRVMYVKMDDGAVEGVLKTDGYVDGRKYTPRQVAEFISDRVDVLGAA